MTGVGPGAPDFDGWTCPAPLRDQAAIVMGHGGGGRMSGELVRHLLLPAFDGTAMAGVIAAKVQLTGIAPEVDILSARAFAPEAETLTTRGHSRASTAHLSGTPR